MSTDPWAALATAYIGTYGILFGWRLVLRLIGGVR